MINTIYYRDISSVAVSTQCYSNNNKHIKVYPGQTITIGLQAYV